MTARWYRGNLHTHTTNSDGDSAPDVVVSWYRDAGYDFLVVTDHDVLTDPDGLRDAAGPMTLIRGEEISSGDVHVNGLGIRERIAATFAASVVETIQGNVDSVRAQGGVPSVNHPNFRWLVRPEDLAALRDVRLFEIHNAGPEVNNLGGRPGFPSMESTWDALLSADHRMLGVAVDDAHHFQVWGRPYSNPGRAWMMRVCREPHAVRAAHGARRGRLLRVDRCDPRRRRTRRAASWRSTSSSSGSSTTGPRSSGSMAACSMSRKA